MKKKLVWVLYACLLAFPLQVFAGSCSGKSKDTERVSGRMAVFYAPSQAQFNSLSQEDQEAYTELLSDFYEYIGQLGRFLDKHDIKHILTGSRYIEVKSGGKAYCFDKTKLEEELGVILSDGKRRPKLVQGVFTDLEMMPTVVDHFSLK